MKESVVGFHRRRQRPPPPHPGKRHGSRGSDLFVRGKAPRRRTCRHGGSAAIKVPRETPRNGGILLQVRALRPFNLPVSCRPRAVTRVSVLFEDTPYDGIARGVTSSAKHSYEIRSCPRPAGFRSHWFDADHCGRRSPRRCGVPAHLPERPRGRLIVVGQAKPPRHGSSGGRKKLRVRSRPWWFTPCFMATQCSCERHRNPPPRGVRRIGARPRGKDCAAAAGACLRELVEGLSEDDLGCCS